MSSDAKNLYKEDILALKENTPGFRNLEVDCAKFKVSLNSVLRALKKRGFPKICSEWEVYSDLGEIFGELDSQDLSISYYDKVINFNSSNSWLHHRKAKILSKLNRKEDAVDAYRKFIELHMPRENFWVYIELGDLYLDCQKYLFSIETYKRAIKLSPDRPEAYCFVGRVLSRIGEYDQSIDYFYQALDRRPDYLPAYNELKLVFNFIGKTEEALLLERQIIPLCLTKRRNRVDKTLLPKRIQSFMDKDVKFEGSYSQNYVELSAPKTLAEKIHVAFLVSKIAISPKYLVKIENGKGWFSGESNVIFTRDGKVVEDVSCGSIDWIGSSKKLPTKKLVGNKVCCLAAPGAAQIYYHWMIDLLPRIQYLDSEEFQSIDKFLVNKFNLNFQIETFNKLGIVPEKVVEASSYPHIYSNQLVVPSLKGKNQIISQESLQFLRSNFIPEIDTNKKNVRKRLYLSRESAKRRKVTNELQVVNLLNSYGFECVAMDNMTVESQASLLSKAEIVIAPHGAALTNIVFCPPGTKVIELFSLHIPTYYWLLANACSLDYYYLDCNPGKSSDNQFDFLSRNYANLDVNIEELKQIVSYALDSI